MDNQVVTGEFGKAKTTVRRNVGASRIKNDELRGRRNLTKKEIDKICTSIRKSSRYAGRDELMVLAAYHHGFRVSELLNLKWQHIDLDTHQMAIKRLKNGINTSHPISHKGEMMLLRRLHKLQGKPVSGFVFINERKSPVTVDGFRKMFSKQSKSATGIQWNPHALRHSCGTNLIDKGHDIRTVQVYMGHRNIQNTTVYLHESSKQFDSIEW